MVEIIETNMIFNTLNQVCDHQSRVVKAESWEEYVTAYNNYNGELKVFNSLTGIYGASIPANREIKELKYDDFHLSCKIYGVLPGYNFHTAFLIDKDNEIIWN